MIYTIDDYLRGEIPPGEKVLCPFHDDATASAQIMPDTGNFWCYRCQIGGDVTAVAGRLWFPHLDPEYSFSLAGALLSRNGAREHIAPRRAQPPADDPRMTQLLTLWWQLCHEQLAADPALVTTLQQTRGLHDPLALGLGLAHPQCFRQLLTLMAETDPDWRDDGEELLVRAGILSRSSDRAQYQLDQRIIIPEIRKRDVIYYQARAQAREHRLRYLNPRFPRPLFGWESLGQKTPIVWLVEGVFDMLPLVEAGQSALSCGGLGLNQETISTLLPEIRDRPVAVVFDNDPPDKMGHQPGLEAGAKRVEALASAGLVAQQIMPPEPYKDVNDWIVARGTPEVIATVTWWM